QQFSALRVEGSGRTGAGPPASATNRPGAVFRSRRDRPGLRRTSPFGSSSTPWPRKLGSPSLSAGVAVWLGTGRRQDHQGQEEVLPVETAVQEMPDRGAAGSAEGSQSRRNQKGAEKREEEGQKGEASHPHRLVRWSITFPINWERSTDRRIWPTPESCATLGIRSPRSARAGARRTGRWPISRPTAGGAWPGR